MELEEQEASRIWWKGTLKGALKGLLVGLAVGALTALVLQFVAIPAIVAVGLPTISHAFASFLTLTPALASGWAGGIVPMAAFSVVPLAIFSGISGMLGNLLGAGNDAVNAYHQQKHNRWQEQQDAKISQIESREQAIEQHLSSPHIKKILAQGPRAAGSFAEAEAQRDTTPGTPTIH